jgi:hypothetical protein
MVGRMHMRASAASSRFWLECVPINRSIGTCIVSAGRYDGFPFVQDETAKSHLLRIMDFWNTKMWDDTSTNAICKEVILTLLQCAARLYEDKVHTKAAVDLIESNYTRAILSLGFQDILCQVVHQGGGHLLYR